MSFKVSRDSLSGAQQPETPAEPAACPPERVWTERQGLALDHFEKSRSSAVVVARAGVGKTTVALEGVRRAPERRVLLTSFSKSATDNLKPRAPGWADCKSLHGVGLRLIGRHWRGVDVDNKSRGRALAVRACPAGTPYETLRVVEALHTKAREIAPLASTVAEVEDVANDFDVSPPMTASLADVAGWALRAMELATQRTDKVDFADMIFLPLKNQWLTPIYDLVVCDELQDTTAPQSAIARGVCGGRFVGIGDPRQAIFAFRGADSGSIARIKGELQAVELLIPDTFRCGRAIVAEAQKLVPDFTAHPSVCDGEVRQAGLEQAMLEAAVGAGQNEGDFVLSRTNAPLVGVALRLLKQDKKCRILGRDIAAGLLGLTTRLSRKLDDRSDVWLFVDLVWEWYAREEANVRESESSSAFRRLGRVKDQADMVEALSEGLSTLGDLRKRIETVFSDDGSGRGVVCSNVHQIKGREARRVYLLRETFSRPTSCKCRHFASVHAFPGGSCRNSGCGCQSYERDSEAALEEENIRYVAITRAKETLTWVS